jgi:hypothetical protein
MKVDINRPEFTGRRARTRSRFSSVASERLYMQKMELAKRLRQHGTRFSAEFMARNTDLETLKRKLNWIEGCVGSI